jgi:hypothetical protein
MGARRSRMVARCSHPLGREGWSIKVEAWGAIVCAVGGHAVRQMWQGA